MNSLARYLFIVSFNAVDSEYDSVENQKMEDFVLVFYSCYFLTVSFMGIKQRRKITGLQGRVWMITVIIQKAMILLGVNTNTTSVCMCV